MKSLSKGNSKKDPLSSSTINLKASTTLPLSSILQHGTTFEDDIGDSWAENADREDYDIPEEFQEPEKPLWKKNGKVDFYSMSSSDDKVKRANGQTKFKDPPKFETKKSQGDDDLSALLKVWVLITD